MRRSFGTEPGCPQPGTRLRTRLRRDYAGDARRALIDTWAGMPETDHSVKLKSSISAPGSRALSVQRWKYVSGSRIISRSAVRK